MTFSLKEIINIGALPVKLLSSDVVKSYTS